MATVIAVPGSEFDAFINAFADPLEVDREEARPIVAWAVYQLMSLRIHKPAQQLYPSLQFPAQPMPQPDPDWPA